MKRATPPLTFPRADPKALKAFDPRTKVCVMNCGPHNLDPRDDKERKFLCGDCYISCTSTSARSSPSADSFTP